MFPPSIGPTSTLPSWVPPTPAVPPVSVAPWAFPTITLGPLATLSPLPSADDDVAAAVVKVWQADPQLTKLVPGGLERGRLSSYQPNVEPRLVRQKPYAAFDVETDGEQLRMSGPAPSTVNRRKVTIQLRGLKPDVSAALAYVRQNRTFNRVPLPTQAFCMGCWQEVDTDLKEDEATKQGDNIWMGLIHLSVWTSRPE